jgi:uncharacterized protein YndB with AHSA1/START domain
MVAAEPVVHADPARRRVSSFRAGRRRATRRDACKRQGIRGGRITVWRPGERLALTWRQATFAPDQSTELDVRFEPTGDETRVTVEHRGWDAIPQNHVARHGFELMLFQRRKADHWRALLASLNAVLRNGDE